MKLTILAVAVIVAVVAAVPLLKMSSEIDFFQLSQNQQDSTSPQTNAPANPPSDDGFKIHPSAEV